MTSDGPNRPSEAEVLAALPLPELARAWAAAARTGDSPDAPRQDMYEATSFLLRSDPDKALALVRTVVSFETDPDVLAYLAAGLLEDIAHLATLRTGLIEAIELAIAADRRFAELFLDIYFNGLEGLIEDRILAAVRAKLR